MTIPYIWGSNEFGQLGLSDDEEEFKLQIEEEAKRQVNKEAQGNRAN
jgi:alpha-tubulin suppressor-like RCC1 family protein